MKTVQIALSNSLNEIILQIVMITSLEIHIFVKKKHCTHDTKY